MVTEKSRDLRYESALRVIGAQLDEAQPLRFSILELDKCFSVILTRLTDRPRTEEMTMDFEGLRKADEDGQDERGIPRPPFPVPWSVVSSGRENALRALGHELDRAEAYGLLVDEIEAGLLATYSYLDPRQGYQWRKRESILTTADLERIIEVREQQEARETKKSGFFTRLTRGQD